jgi:hypothetical protein
MSLETGVDRYPSGRWCLDVAGASEATYALFDGRNLHGGGPTWEGIVCALVGMYFPDAASRLDIGAEADNMHVYSDDEDLLRQLEELVRKADTNHQLLIEAIEFAGDDLE